MKVALVVGQFPALSETFVLNQITGLLDRGVEVDIYAGTRNPQPAEHPAVSRYNLLRRTTYPRAVPKRASVRKAQMLTLLLGALYRARSSAVRVRRVLNHGRADANAAFSFSRLPGNGTREYDVIHCHFGHQGQRGMAMRNMGLLSGKLVTTFHGSDMSRYLRSTGTDVYDRLFTEGDLFLPISRFWEGKLIDLGCDSDRITVHHMGIDCGSFTFSARDLPADGKVRLLSVARLVEKKGIEFAVRAVARMTDRYPGVEYTIVGDGPLGASLTRLAEQLGVADRVKLVGGKNRDEVIRAMRGAHALLAPSVTSVDGDQEGIPVVLMEAMATGLPVLSTYHSGIPELVEDGTTGYLVAERDDEGLAKKLVRLFEDPAAYERIAAAARDRVERGFDIAKLNDRLLEVFQKVQR